MQNPKHQLVLPEAKSCSQGNPAWRAEPRATPLYLHSVSRAHTPSRNAQRSNPTSACRRNTRRKADSRPSGRSFLPGHPQDLSGVSPLGMKAGWKTMASNTQQPGRALSPLLGISPCFILGLYLCL